MGEGASCHPEGGGWDQAANEMNPPDMIIIIVFGEGVCRFFLSDSMSETNGMEGHADSVPAPDVTRLLGGTEARRSARITFSIDRILGREEWPADRQKNAGSAPEDSPADQHFPEPPIWIYCSRFSARPTAGE